MRKYILISMLILIPSLSWAQQKEDDQWSNIITEVTQFKDFTVDVNQVTPRRGRTFYPSMPYRVTIQNDSVISYLPYMGRATTITYGGGEGLNFRAPLKDYKAEVVKNKKINVIFNTKSRDENYRYHFTIYPNGKATIDVQAIGRESISFMGEIRGHNQ